MERKLSIQPAIDYLNFSRLLDEKVAYTPKPLGKYFFLYLVPTPEKPCLYATFSFREELLREKENELAYYPKWLLYARPNPTELILTLLTLYPFFNRVYLGYRKTLDSFYLTEDALNAYNVIEQAFQKENFSPKSYSLQKG